VGKKGRGNKAGYIVHPPPYRETQGAPEIYILPIRILAARLRADDLEIISKKRIELALELTQVLLVKKLQAGISEL
jgi:hypothetical protein